MLQDFFLFRILVTPSVLITVYALGAVGMPLVVLLIRSRIRDRFFPAAERKSPAVWRFRLFVVGMLFMAELAWRIFIEFFVVYFQIRDALSG